MSIRLTKAYRGGYQGRPGWWLHFPYDEDALTYIKAYPVMHRAWDERQKRWWVADEIAEYVAVWMPSFEAFLKARPLL